MNIGKEASNLNMTRKTCLDTWDQAASKLFTAADLALTACLNQLNLTATAGALLPQTMLYKASDEKRLRNNNKLFVGPKKDEPNCTGDIIYALTGYMPMPEGHGRRFCAGFLWNGPACQLNPCPTPHIQINDLPQADQQIWIDHVRRKNNMSFNAVTVNQSIVTASLLKKEPSKPHSKN